MQIITFNCPGEFDINRFGNFDLFFIQRCPADMLATIPYSFDYIENYSGRGLCIVSKDESMLKNVSNGEFSWYNESADETQGKHWQTLTTYIGPGCAHPTPYKFINGLPSYPEPDGSILDKHRILQTKELINMIDISSMLVGDFHSADHQLEDEINLTKNNLVNHIEYGTFTCDNGYVDSIDKIITTTDSLIVISNVSVIKYDREDPGGHWPIRFELKTILET